MCGDASVVLRAMSDISLCGHWCVVALCRRRRSSMLLLRVYRPARRGHDRARAFLSHLIQRTTAGERDTPPASSMATNGQTHSAAPSCTRFSFVSEIALGFARAGFARCWLWSLLALLFLFFLFFSQLIIMLIILLLISFLYVNNNLHLGNAMVN